MDILLEYLFLFCFCAMIGWCIEVVYRGFRHHKVVNPGFLTGCWLPIYGCGGCVLYFLSSLELNMLPNKFLRVACVLLLAAAIMTVIELIGGWIALKLFHVRLWDYTDEWMNYKGLICPKFSLFWGLICALYYFLLYPMFHAVASRVIDTPWLILVLGLCMGVFLVDLVHSLRLMKRIRAYAVRMKTLIDMNQLKNSAKEYFQKEQGERSPFNFSRMVGRYLHDVLHSYRDQIERKWGGEK